MFVYGRYMSCVCIPRQADSDMCQGEMPDEYDDVNLRWSCSTLATVFI